MKQICCENKAECKKQSGSTMVGVLAATVFIGIVTTFMVNNTKSQSEAGRSYRTVADISSTQNSGVIASQRHLARPAAAQDFLQIAQTVLAGGQPPENTLLIGGAGGTRRSIKAGRQAFSSQLLGNSIQVLPATQEILGAITINSGRGENVNQGGFQRMSVAFGQFAGIQFINQPNAALGFQLDGETNVIANVPLNIVGGFSSDNHYFHQRNITVDGIAWLPNGRGGPGPQVTFTASGGIRDEVYPLDCRSQPFNMAPINNLGNAFIITAGAVNQLNNGSSLVEPTRYTLEGNINITVAALARAYEHALTSNPTRLFNGTHLVVEINAGVNWPADFGNDVFSYIRPNGDVQDINIIFVVNVGMGGNGFPASTATSSTMIYMAPPTPVPTTRSRCQDNNGNPPRLTPIGQGCRPPPRMRCQRANNGNIYMANLGQVCDIIFVQCQRESGTIDIVLPAECNPADNDIILANVPDIFINWDDGENEIEIIPAQQLVGGGQFTQAVFRQNFRGIIYIPPENNLNHMIGGATLTLTGGMQINGSGLFQWNNNSTDGGDGLLTIVADQAAINSFGIPRRPLLDAQGNIIPPNPECGTGVTLTLPVGDGVTFQPFSFYYF